MNHRSKLFNTRFWIFIFISISFTALSCKKWIYKVEVRVFDESTNEGIPDISLFTESGNEYITNSEGKVKIKGEGNLKGSHISTSLTIQGYVHSEYFNTCEVSSEYEIKENQFETHKIIIE